jgi:hypothetical protein
VRPEKFCQSRRTSPAKKQAKTENLNPEDGSDRFLRNIG